MSGGWQLFALHRGTKNGSYTPARLIVILSNVHQYQQIHPAHLQSETSLRYFILAAAIGLIVTTLLGVVMAFRFGRSKAAVILSLLAGIVVPLGLLSTGPRAGEHEAMGARMPSYLENSERLR